MYFQQLKTELDFFVGITAVPNFQVLLGSPAKFPWNYTGTVTSANWFDTDGTKVMMKYETNAASKESGYDDLIDFIKGDKSMGMTIRETAADDTGDYKVEITFTDADTDKTLSETTKLTVITSEYLINSYILCNNYLIIYMQTL